MSIIKIENRLTVDALVLGLFSLCVGLDSDLSNNTCRNIMTSRRSGTGRYVRDREMALAHDGVAGVDGFPLGVTAGGFALSLHGDRGSRIVGRSAAERRVFDGRRARTTGGRCYGL
jgi:hypothetical protein